MKKQTIMVSGIGGAVATQIAKYLRQKGHRIIGVDCNIYANSLYNKNICHNSELISDIENNKYFTQIKNLYKKYKCDLLVITNEVELEAWSRRGVDKEIVALVPPFEFFDLANSKFATYELLKKYKIVPETIYINKESDLKNAAKKLTLPMWIRKDRGQAAPNAYLAHSVKKAKDWIEFKDGWGEFTASEYLPGKNVAWTGLYQEGKLITAIGYERPAYINSISAPSGVTGTASVCITTQKNKYRKIAKQVLDIVQDHLNIRLTGLYTVDFKEDSKGVPKVTEINPRPSNTYLFGATGCKMIDMFVSVALGVSVKSLDCSCSKKDVYYLRAVDLEPTIINDDVFRKLQKTNKKI